MAAPAVDDRGHANHVAHVGAPCGGIATSLQRRGRGFMAVRAQGGQPIEAVEVPAAVRRIPAVVDLELLGGIAETAAVTVATQRALAQRLPGGARQVVLVAQGRPAGWR
jgi:hypothetical protein